MPRQTKQQTIDQLIELVSSQDEAIKLYQQLILEQQEVILKSRVALEAMIEAQELVKSPR